MLNALVKQISKLFGGSKSERDVKQLMPIVEQINAHYAEYLNLSNDALRAKTTELKQRLKDELSVFEEKINAIKAEIKELNNEEEILAIYRRVRDEIKIFVDHLEEFFHE